MSTAELGRVATLVLREAFGEIVEQVGSYLVKNGARNLSDITKATGLTRDQVKKSLCVLLQHQLSTHQDKKPTSLYRVDPDSVLLRVQIPRWIRVAKQLFGDAGELVVEDILQQGHTFKSQCIERVSKHLESYGEVGHIVKKQFESLVKDGYIQQVKCLVKTSASQVTSGSEQEAEETTGDTGKHQSESRGAEEPQAKKRKIESEVTKEEEEEVEGLWQINCDRFQQFLRDQAIVSAVARQVDETAANIIKTILSLSLRSAQHTSISTPKTRDVFCHEIVETLPDKLQLNRVELEQYLKVLVDQQMCILQKSDESGGGAYSLNFKKASEILCKATIECIVKETFGSKMKYFRVFRLLLEKKVLDQKQVSDMAMVPSKEAKEILYTLLAEKFISLQEIPKTPDYAPSRTFYLFSVQLLPVAIMVRERCYKALGNLTARRAMEYNDNKRLLERFEQQERQQAELKKGVVMEEEEMEEVLTPDEKEKVEAIKRSIAKLEHAELQLDETIMTINNYLTLHMNSTPAR